jgi:hypothetical protein
MGVVNGRGESARRPALVGISFFSARQTAPRQQLPEHRKNIENPANRRLRESSFIHHVYPSRLGVGVFLLTPSHTTGGLHHSTRTSLYPRRRSLDLLWLQDSALHCCLQLFWRDGRYVVYVIARRTLPFLPLPIRILCYLPLE